MIGRYRRWPGRWLAPGSAATRLLAAVFLAVSTPSVRSAPAAPPGPPGLAEILAHFGFEDPAKTLVLGGEIVSTRLAAAREKELAGAAVMLVHAPIDRVFEALRGGLTFDVNRSITAHLELGDRPANEIDLDGIGFGPEDEDEVLDLLDLEAGSDFNLSRSEIAQFRVISTRFRGRGRRRSAAAREAVTGVYRRILRQRYRAYRRGGLDAIGAYAREDDGEDAARPGDELRAAASAATLLARHDPAFHLAFADYPEAGIAGLVHRFHCMKHVVDDRPAFILVHRNSRFDARGSVIAERQFYVGHTYNSLQTIIGLVPRGDATIVYLTNRTSTDRVAGFGTSVAHRVGGGRLRDAIEDHVRALRSAIERPVGEPAGGG